MDWSVGFFYCYCKVHFASIVLDTQIKQPGAVRFWAVFVSREPCKDVGFYRFLLGGFIIFIKRKTTRMETLLLQSESKKDLKMFAELAKKVGLKTYSVSKEEMEDIGLAKAMKKGRTGEYINTAAYLKKIKAQ